MRSDATLRRRRFLGGLATTAALGSLAGCGESSESPATPEHTDDASGVDDGTEAVGDSGETAGDSTERSGGSASELDLREANVVDVASESGGGGGAYGFDVTLHHDDDGEDGYANWWQVERLDGTQLGRRDLLHAHSRQPFTRSATIDIPGDVGCVVVRGHDQTHGYGGRAMLVDLASGATRTVGQGPERQAFDESDCP